MKTTILKKLILATAIIPFLTGCQNKNTIDDTNIVVGASITPHAEILRQARPYIESQGYTLEIVEFNDYVLPNEGVAEGSLDANFFQHKPYLDGFNQEKNTNIVEVAKIHFEPLGVYAGKNSFDVNDIVNTIDRKAQIGIPNDSTNGARALILLENLGIIKLDASKGLNVTAKDIIQNPYEVEIIEFTAEQLPTQLSDLDYAVINGNYALSGNVLDKAIEGSFETSKSEGATLYANIIACQSGNENSKAIKLLVEALKQDNVTNYIKDTYQGLVLPYLE